VSDNDIRVGLKEAATVLGYPERESPLTGSILIHCELEVQMPCPWWVGLTGISKSWDDGVARLSGSTFGNNCQIFGRHVEKHEEVLWFCERGGGRLLQCDYNTVVGMDYNVLVSEGAAAA
jgi:hypothetical protein